jgi:hypothetical protein
MSISFVLRLVPDALAERRIAGRIEVVATGEQTGIHDSDELLEFLYTHAAAAQQPASVQTTEATRVR